jgi:hypothetical protein
VILSAVTTPSFLLCIVVKPDGNVFCYSIALHQTPDELRELATFASKGIGRANALESTTSQGANADAARIHALAAYKDFLDLWKHADPDIRILLPAKAKYAKLK